MEQDPGDGAGSFPPGSWSEPEASEIPDSVLQPRVDEINADALLIYSRTRYLAARQGLVSPHEFALDLARHVRSQLPARHGAAANTAATIRRRV